MLSDSGVTLVKHASKHQADCLDPARAPRSVLPERHCTNAGQLKQSGVNHDWTSVLAARLCTVCMAFRKATINAQALTQSVLTTLLGTTLLNNV